MKKRLSLFLLVFGLLIFSAFASAQPWQPPDWIKVYIKYPNSNWTQAAKCNEQRTCNLEFVSGGIQNYCREEGNVSSYAQSSDSGYVNESSKLFVYDVNYDEKEASCICLRESGLKNTSWGTELNAISYNLPYACCGDDAGDQGLIFFDRNASEYYICDNSGPDMVWRGISTGMYLGQWHNPSLLNVGAIYHINTTAGIFGTFTSNLQTQSYDVVGTRDAKWIPCDIDRSLTGVISYHSYNPTTNQTVSFYLNKTQVYAPSGVFNMPCVGNSTPNCQQIDDNDFVCYAEAKNESIFECAYKQEALSLDERSVNMVGDIIPKLFSDNLAKYFTVIPRTCTEKPFCCQSEYCIEFTSSITDTHLKKAPRLKDWTGYGYFTFNINFEKPNNSGNFTISINSWQDSLSKYLIGMPKNGWYRVMVPLTVLNNKVVSSFSISKKQATTDLAHVKFADFRLEGGELGIYCGERQGGDKAEWRKDLDTDTTSNGTACNAQKTTQWTGNYCCNDDYTRLNEASGYYSEFYTDKDGNCWDGKKVGNSGVIVNVSNMKSILSFEDKFYGCFATNLFGIRNTNNNTPVVQGRGVCESYGSFYCSNYERGWSNLGYLAKTLYVAPQNRTALKYSPDTSTADCCRLQDCWNGTTCNGDQSQDTQALPYGIEQGQMITPDETINYSGYRCMNGEWINSTIKWDWYDQNWGYCGNETECLLNTTACVQDGWYSRNIVAGGMNTADFYCKNGAWTTRTRQLAQVMLKLRKNDYVFDCGPFSKVLNYWWPSQFQQSESFENIASNFELNNFCILSYKGLLGGEHIVIGTTFNPEAGVGIEYVLANAFNLINKDVSGCSQDDGKFHDCGSGLWWNEKEQSLIYDPSKSIDLDGNIFTGLYDFFLKQIYNILGIQVPITVGEKTVQFLSRARLLNDVYISKQGNTMIRAFVETKYEEPELKQFFTATYENFTVSVCDSISTYDFYVANEFEGVDEQDVYCTRLNNTNIDVVIAVDKALGTENFDKFVSLLTRRTRVS